MAPALLNSADIYDYARITGMICPFETDEERLKTKLKPASYEIDFLGTVYLINDRGVREVRGITRDSPFTLPKNSIAFVSLATLFLLPDYIALRFNLKITHVHRGLLLGTGPLVDPGFAGRLLIPLHNLTSEDYVLIGGNGLIWAEFTKLSPHLHWNAHARQAAPKYVHYPERKQQLTAQQYFNNVSQGDPARSSIPVEVRIARETAEEAKKIAEESMRQRKLFTLAGIAAVVGIIWSTWTIISQANKNVADASITISASRKAIDVLRIKVDSLENDLKSLRQSPNRAPAAKTLPKKPSAP